MPVICPSGPGLTSTEMTEAALEGRLKALYIIGEDPVVCDANIKKTSQALESLDFLVVQEIFMTATARMADLVLPAAAWAEKDGSYTSMERRVQWIDQALCLPGEAKEGLWIINEIARRMGLRVCPLKRRRGAGGDQPSGASVRGHDQESGSRRSEDCAGPVRMRSIPERIFCTRRGSPPRRKGQDRNRGKQAAGEQTSPEYPILLSTGRIVVHYNSGSMTMRSPSLQERDFELYVEINPEDAQQLKVSTVTWLR